MGRLIICLSLLGNCGTSSSIKTTVNSSKNIDDMALDNCASKLVTSVIAAFGSIYLTSSSTETPIPARCNHGSRFLSGITSEERYCGSVRASSFKDVPKYANSNTISITIITMSNDTAITRGIRSLTIRCTTGLSTTAINNARINGTMISAATRMPLRMITSMPSIMTIFRPLSVMIGFAMCIPAFFIFESE